MKVNKRRASHWCYLLLFSINVVMALLLRWLPGGAGRPRVILYGHKLNGNLLAILEQARAEGRVDDFAFLTMDPAYHREMLALGWRSVLGIMPSSIAVMARMQAVISDHGLHSLELIHRFSSVRFFDVWHGIPFKGFDRADFRLQRRYDEVWVASPLMRDIYENRYGFDASRLAVTGYARTDRLLSPKISVMEARHYLGLEPSDSRRVVLFAPTWKQDARGRSIFPFGVSEESFFDCLQSLAERLDVLMLFRAHLNSERFNKHTRSRVLEAPQSKFPDTEMVLKLASVLVCDWSSIAFDYLLLDRPTIFLDVEAPFRKGFSLGPEYRYGAVVKNLDEMMGMLVEFIEVPGGYAERHSAEIANVRADVYGAFADGRSAERCLRRLDEFLVRAESSR
jgi:CDP-glycerol glycerophosphotransferase